jgi:hypothetical protein
MTAVQEIAAGCCLLLRDFDQTDDGGDDERA